MPLSYKCRTCRLCQRLHPFGGAGERSERERVRPGSKPSPSRPLAVPPLPRGRGFGKGGRYRPHQLTGIKQKLHALAKGSPFGGAVERSETERVRSEANPLRHGLWPCHLSREGEALAERVRPCKKPQGLPKGPGVSRFISLGVCALIPLRPGRRVLLRRLRPQPPSQPAPPQSALRRLHPAPPSRPVPRRRARCGPAPSPYRPRPGA